MMAPGLCFQRNIVRRRPSDKFVQNVRVFFLLNCHSQGWQPGQLFHRREGEHPLNLPEGQVPVFVRHE